jgi:hypothetical protein
MKAGSSATAVLAALGLLTATPALAQTDPGSQTSATGGLNTDNRLLSTVSGEKLDQYGMVLDQLQRQKSDLTGAGKEKPTAVTDTRWTDQDISTAIQTSNATMTVEEFKMIHARAQSDPEFRAKVEKRGGSASGAASTSAQSSSSPSVSGGASATVSPSGTTVQSGAEVSSSPSTSGAGAQASSSPGQSGAPKIGQTAPLPEGALGTGPASATGGTQPSAAQPGTGTGAPVVIGGQPGTAGSSDSGSGTKK